MLGSFDTIEKPVYVTGPVMSPVPVQVNVTLGIDPLSGGLVRYPVEPIRADEHDQPAGAEQLTYPAMSLMVTNYVTVLCNVSNSPDGLSITL